MTVLLAIGAIYVTGFVGMFLAMIAANVRGGTWGEVLGGALLMGVLWPAVAAAVVFDRMMR